MATLHSHRTVQRAEVYVRLTYMAGRLRLTETDLEAAANLVLLSERSGISGEAGWRPADSFATACCSSSSSSSFSLPSSSSSVTSDNTGVVASPTCWPASEDASIDEEPTGPWARRRRYRSLSMLYAATMSSGPGGVVVVSSSKRNKRVRTSTPQAAVVHSIW